MPHRKVGQLALSVSSNLGLVLQNLFRSYFIPFLNKLECLSLPVASNLAEAYQSGVLSHATVEIEETDIDTLI